MATIVLRNGWNEPQNYNATSVTFLDPNGNEVTFYENGSGGGGGGGTGGVGVQADWAQINLYHPSYIKNRPFYSYYDIIVEPSAKAFEVDAHNLYVVELQLEEPILEGQDYIVYWKENGYLCKAKLIEGDLILGDASLIKEVEQEEDPEPFVGYFVDGVNKLVIGTPEQTSLELVGLFSSEEKIQVIDKKFLPNDIVGLDEERLADFLKENEYAVLDDIATAFTKFEKRFPAKVEEMASQVYVNEAIEEINKALENYAKTSWVKDNYTTKTETTNLSNRVKTIEDNYINKTTFKTLEDTVTALQKALADYKNEVSKTYATKTELADSQADWSIEDKTNPAAIKNKPFGDIPDILTNATFAKEEFTTSTDENGVVTFYLDIGQTLDATKQYTVIWNGVTRTCTPNVNISNSVFQLSSEGIFTATGVEEVTTITLRLTDNVYRVDKKYLPVSEIVSGYATQTYVNNKVSEIPAPNWNETDTNSKAYIWNKPTIPAAQVNADWNATSGKAKILNKPTIPPAPEQPDWNEIDEKKLSFIQHKPTIPAAQVQSNWAQDDPSKIDFIKGRPEFYSSWDATEGRARIANMPTVFRHSNDREGTEEVLLDTPEGWTKKTVSKLTMTVTFDDDSVKIYSMVGEEVVE